MPFPAHRNACRCAARCLLTRPTTQSFGRRNGLALLTFTTRFCRSLLLCRRAIHRLFARWVAPNPRFKGRNLLLYAALFLRQSAVVAQRWARLSQQIVGLVNLSTIEMQREKVG